MDQYYHRSILLVINSAQCSTRNHLGTFIIKCGNHNDDMTCKYSGNAGSARISLLSSENSSVLYLITSSE